MTPTGTHVRARLVSILVAIAAVIAVGAFAQGPVNDPGGTTTTTSSTTASGMTSSFSSSTGLETTTTSSTTKTTTTTTGTSSTTTSPVTMTKSSSSSTTTETTTTTTTMTMTTRTSASTLTTTGTTAQNRTVQIVLPIDVGTNESLNFQPTKIRVVIGVNNTIVWNDLDGLQHTVKSTSVPRGAKPFYSGILNQGQTFTVTLTVPGTYRYDCSIHPDWMRGSIEVVA